MRRPPTFTQITSPDSASPSEASPPPSSVSAATSSSGEVPTGSMASTAEGGGANSVKRGVLSWTIAAIGDRKSAKWVREELVAKLENMRAFWVEGMRAFWETVARVCEGEAELSDVEAGVRIIVGFAKNFMRDENATRSLLDDSRTGRDNSKFTPKGEHLLGTEGE